MKRLLIPFVVAFGLSLGIATGVVIVRSPKPVAAAAKAVPSKLNSPHTAQAKHDTTSAESPLPGNVTAATAAAITPGNPGTPVLLASAHATPQNGEPTGAPPGAQKNVSVSDASKAPQAAAQIPAQDTVTGKRIAKVFGAMQARDAARVLEQMDDADV
ncbi:MAG: hypothetical protein ACR2MQ_00435 [Gemmatimonadaceae bacterium]